MKPVRTYANFVANHPYIVILLVLMITVGSIYFMSKIENKSSDYKDMLPDGVDVIEAFDTIEENFGGSESALISIELDPEYINSNEPKDILEYEVVQYIGLLTDMVVTIEDISSANSAASLLEMMNGGILPKQNREIKDFVNDNPLFDGYVSKDRTMALIRINLGSDYDAEEIEIELGKLIQEVKKPAGLSVYPAGDTMSDPVVMRTIGPEMQKTSNFSLLAILLILLLMIGNPKYALSPLLVILIGVMWAMGFVGMIGMGMTSATSSAVSMIMGIGIDFGIQVITRFRSETKNSKSEVAIVKTMENVFMPMFTTTIAALIGFQAMTMGNLTMMQDLGRMMGYGVASCFLAAVTILPAILVLLDKVKIRDILKKLVKS